MRLKRFIYVLLFVLPVTSLKAQSGNIEFIENKGQWDKKVKFLGDVPAGSFFIREGGGFTVLQHNPDDLREMQAVIHSRENKKSTDARQMPRQLSLRSHAFHVDFVGGSAGTEIIPDKPLNTYNNYFIGNDPSKWASNCKVYQGVTVKNVYPNVDVRYYTQDGTLKYDIIANPGADLGKIALKYDGVDKLETQKKQLSISTSVGKLKELSPYTFQFNAKGKKDLNCRYVVKDNIVKFEVKNYDRNSTIVIDPSVVFITFSGSKANNWGYTATYGPDGSMFGGGIVFADGFPTNTGAFQEHYKGGIGNSDEGEGPFDIGIIKLSPDGKNRVYATYIGGENGDEQPHSLVVDGSGNLVLAGRSNSDDYPTTGTGVIGSGGAYDIVVTKLDATGSRLLGSKRIGGASNDGVNISATRSENSLQLNYGDDGRSEVILDGAGNIYVASCTQSDDFPAVGGFQTRKAVQRTTDNGDLHNQDGVILKLRPDVSALLFSSYLGGDGDDAAYVLSLDPAGNIYVGGATSSKASFPGITGGVISSTNVGIIDGFVSIVSANGSAVKSSYIGTSGRDAIYGLKFDRKGFPYIMGQTYGNDWPVINATYSNPGAKQFIAKLKPDLSGWVYSTVFGKNDPTPSISPVAFLVDRCENVYVSGWGGAPKGFASSGTTNLPVTADAYQSTSVDNADFYFFVLKKDATAQLYGSFLGETGGFPDHVDGGTSRFDQNGVIYQGICGDCVPLDESGRKPHFPTTGGWSPQNGSRYCNLAMAKIAFNLAGVGAGLQASIDGVPRDTAGCVPLTVDFRDTVANAKTYEWTFGDGSPTTITTVPNISHTYTNIGTYTVTLVAVDSSTCNMRDTVITHIRAGNKRASLALNFTKLDPCDAFSYQFNNLSVAPPDVPFGPQSFVWSFGDDTPLDTTGTGSVLHNYVAPGSYHVTLTLIDSNYCNAPEILDTVLSVAALVNAGINTPPTGCAPYTVTFDNTSIAGQTFIWDFGDGSATSTEFAPTHTYTNPGQYTVKLIANNEFTCNKTDDTTVVINVYGKPVADYSYTPIPPVENTPNVFTNLSSDDAISFVWYFGDGDSVATTSRAPVVHQYNATNTFNACLVAVNAAGCVDTICKPVEVIINPLVDVPNAFTPNSGDINSKVMVKGFGIAKMRFIIWNRWGQKVFETNDQRIGWDGRFKGALQPMDVYAYTLDVQFFDGTKATKKGDITLIK